MYIDHRYEVIESLGTGSWANVFRVRDIRNGKEYSLKLFQYLPSEELYKRFSAEEMHHITQIEHPNLNHVVDFGHVGDHIYYISDFFEGSTLGSFRYSKGKLDLLYDIVVQICYALHALHTQNILHKDLKLENILYTIEANTIQIKLIDYGFTKIDLTNDAQRVSGSLPYMAPEVYLGKPAERSSDFFSLGVILYRLTTGSFPYNVNQINALLTGNHQYFLPTFPSELNPDIPLSLEKFILRLLEKNPENRFQSSEDIIAYVNRIHSRNYPFSVAWSMANTIRFNSYIVRSNISHQLVDFVGAIDNNNGKLISLIGGDGLGKDNILSLFRFHMLRGDYFLFDFQCSRTEHEAFFALIKEYIQSISPSEIEEYESLKQISDKFKKFLFDSESVAKGISQSQEELKIDFDSVKSLLLDLSRHKPLIFVIRNFQFVHRYTIDFINYFSPFIINERIMIVLSCNDFNKINQLSHSVMIHIPPLTETETADYVQKLLKTPVSEQLCHDLYDRSAGNPQFIQDILIDLVVHKGVKSQITEIKSLQNNSNDGINTLAPIEFDLAPASYSLPSRLLHSVYQRLSHTSPTFYIHLQKLSIAQTPLNRELIINILQITDQKLYSFLNDVIYNEIMIKKGKNYYFSFLEAKARLYDECDKKTHTEVSKQILDYFDKQALLDIEICQGLIENAKIAGDLISERRYNLKLFHLYNEQYDQDKAYAAIYETLRLDLNPKTKASHRELIQDMNIFQEKTELTGYVEKAKTILDDIKTLPDFFEKYFVITTILLLEEDIKGALVSLQKADHYTLTGKQRVLCLLYYAIVYNRLDVKLMKEFLDKIDPKLLPMDLRIVYVDKIAVYYAMTKDTDRAIKTIESFLAELPSENDTNVMVRLAAMHNDLGVFYSEQKNIDEADEHLNAALTIWKRYNVRRYLGLIYNNISDLYLKQGHTVASVSYSELGYKYANELNLALTKALALLNHGEAMIKMGEFITAEEKLLESQNLVLSVNSKKFLVEIQRNLALAKSKIKNFGHYYKFIQENEPELIAGYIQNINPLVKTYFYYLYEINNTKKLKRLIRKNVHINYKHLHEEEFYHNTNSLLAILEKNYETAMDELKQGLRYAGEVKNQYAITVFYVLQIQCYYGLNDHEKAREIIELAKPMILENNYRYWQYKIYIMELKLDLAIPTVPLRDILRRTKKYLDDCLHSRYYQLAVEFYQIWIQVLLENNCDENIETTFSAYRRFLEDITEDIAEDDKQNFLGVNQYNLKNLRKFDSVYVASRQKNLRTKWNDLLYNIANVSNPERIKFLIQKGINQVLSPYQFRIMEFSERINNFIPFLSYNCERDNLSLPELLPHIEKALRTDTIFISKLGVQNLMIVPLIAGPKQIGYLILTDLGELDFTKQELSIMRNVKQHLTALIIRIQDYSQITKRIEKMNQLMAISHELMRIVNLADLEREIVSHAIDFTNSSRGFLIIKDSDGNYNYRVHLDKSKQLLTGVSGISKSAISICQSSGEPLTTYNAIEDNRFKGSISVQDYQLHCIFVSPIMLDNGIYGFLYLDNQQDNTREMYLNTDMIKLLQEQITIALKNAMQYEAVLQKNSEMHALELIKDEFMAIVSHELNTPLTTLQSYVSRLKRNLFADEDERMDIIGKIETYVKKLILTTGDITTMNNYNMKKSLSKAQINIAEILLIIKQEVEILSRKRRMFIKLDIESDLPNISANWEALHLMIYNIVLNAIRFTNDFGTITISARRSAFQQEKIDGKESMVIIIEDNGIGIPEQQIKNVFRKFYELNEIYAHKSGIIEYRSSGLGLGLATSKRIAELHNGSIWIKSKEKEGTTVFISIPIKQ